MSSHWAKHHVSMFELIRRNINFRNFWYGQLISQMGDRIHTLAVIWLVYSWYNSGAAVGAVLIASTLPAFLISPFAGNILDKYNRKRIMIICDFIRSFFVLGLAVLAYFDKINLPVILIFTVIISIGAAFFNPATMAIMPSIVEKDDLTQANAFYQLSISASGALGFMAGSGLIALIGVPAAFLLNGVSFSLSAFFVFRIIYKHLPVKLKTSFMHDFKEGWKITKGIPLIVRLFGPIIVINFFLAALFILVPVFAEGVFKRGSTGLGLMMTSLTLGMFLGAMVMSKGKPKIKTFILLFSSLLFIGGAFLAMSLFSNFYLHLIMYVFIGMSLNVSNISLMALFQKIVPNEVRGKVFGLLTSASVSAQPISYGIMGLITESASPSAILMFCSVALTATAIFFLTIKELKEVY